MTGAPGPCHEQGRPDVPIIVSRRARSRPSVEWRAAPGSPDSGGGIRRSPTPIRRRTRPPARRRDAADGQPTARARYRERLRSATGRFTDPGGAATEELRRNRRRRSARRWKPGGPEVPEGSPSSSRTGGSSAEPSSARQPVRDARRGWCGMSRTASSRQRRNGDGRLAGTTRDGARSRSRDERNCARWFARFDEHSEESAGRPSRSEVRRLRKELEALRRLVTGEQIP